MEKIISKNLKNTLTRHGATFTDGLTEDEIN